MHFNPEPPDINDLKVNTGVKELQERVQAIADHEFTVSQGWRYKPLLYSGLASIWGTWLTLVGLIIYKASPLPADVFIGGGIVSIVAALGCSVHLAGAIKNKWHRGEPEKLAEVEEFITTPLAKPLLNLIKEHNNRVETLHNVRKLLVADSGAALAKFDTELRTNIIPKLVQDHKELTRRGSSFKNTNYIKDDIFEALPAALGSEAAVTTTDNLQQVWQHQIGLQPALDRTAYQKAISNS